MSFSGIKLIHLPLLSIRKLRILARKPSLTSVNLELSEPYGGIKVDFSLWTHKTHIIVSSLWTLIILAINR
jgi:hypothetical protein